MVNTLAEAMELHEKIVNGGNFAEIAMNHSLCPSKANGGNLGSFGRGQMVKPFEDTAFECPIGAMSQPVQTQFGYHLILRTA